MLLLLSSGLLASSQQKTKETQPHGLMWRKDSNRGISVHACHRNQCKLFEYKHRHNAIVSQVGQKGGYYKLSSKGVIFINKKKSIHIYTYIYIAYHQLY